MRILLFITLLLCVSFPVLAYDDTPITFVQDYPCSTSFSTTVFSVNGTEWITCPTVEMMGRKEVNIFNPSSTYTLYISGVSGNTTDRDTNIRTLRPLQNVTIQASSDMHIYVTSSTIGTDLNVEVVEIK